MPRADKAPHHPLHDKGADDLPAPHIQGIRAHALIFADAYLGRGRPGRPWHTLDGDGNKAIRLKKLPGSRADVDIVPVFNYIWMALMKRALAS
jgi:hypothetical protein